MKKTKVLVLGNDPQINSIDFDRLDPSIITLGVNRIWLKYLPNYFFFHDWDIVTELNNKPETLAKLITTSKIFSSDWYRYYKKPIPTWVDLKERPNAQKRAFPDSITTSMWIFKNYYTQHLSCEYYIAGVSLKWQEPSHFWKTEPNYISKNKFGERWYSSRFLKTLNNFKTLHSSGYKMISVNENSLLNKIMRYQSMDTLYLH